MITKKTKIEGTPILKLAIIKRFVKKYIKKIKKFVTICYKLKPHNLKPR